MAHKPLNPFFWGFVRGGRLTSHYFKPSNGDRGEIIYIYIYLTNITGWNINILSWEILSKWYLNLPDCHRGLFVLKKVSFEDWGIARVKSQHNIHTRLAPLVRGWRKEESPLLENKIHWESERDGFGVLGENKISHFPTNLLTWSVNISWSGSVT